ncbi:MAG: energy transducer TonB [Potamolinea sp.]
MIKKKQTKKLMIFSTTTCRKILTITGLALLTSSVYLGDVQAQSFTNSGSLLIAQNLGGIVRKIPLEEVALPAMSSAKTATNAEFNQARIELKSDGSLIYILRGKNQQGFEVEVQVTPSGTLVQVDEQIESSGVPELAVKAFKKWAPNDPLISTWRSTRLGEFFYQFVIRDFWLEIAADGNKVAIYRKKVKI